MHIGEEQRYVNELNALLAAIGNNRLAIARDADGARYHVKKPALWIDVGRKAMRTYTLTRTGFFVASKVGRYTGLFKLLRLLPLAGAGYGVYQLVQGLSSQGGGGDDGSGVQPRLSGPPQGALLAPESEWRVPTQGTARPGW